MYRCTVPFLAVITCLLMAPAKPTELCYCGTSCCGVPRLCGKVLKELSRLLVVLTMLTVCCACVNANNVRSADDEACHGETISPRNAFFMSGEDLTLICNIQRGSPWGLTFVRGIYAKEVPSKYVKSLNATAIQLVIPNISEEDIRNNNASMQYKCMKEGSNGTCVDVLYVELDYYTVTPRNVSCRIFDFNTMNCSWDLVVKYVHEDAYDVTCEYANLNDDMIEALFLSDISEVKNFTGVKCPNQSQTSCYWNESKYPAPSVLKLKITVNNTRRNIHKDTGWLTFEEYDIVEPGPVKNLRVEDTGKSGCVTIQWEPSTGCKYKNMTFRLIHSSPCSELQEQRNLQGVNNSRVCGLIPYTNYTFSVAGRVLDPLENDTEKGHWSKWNLISYMTKSAVIETNPTISPGLYELINTTNQDGQMSLKLYWKPLSNCDLHAQSDSVTYTIQWNNLTQTVYHPYFSADMLIPYLSALNASLSTTNNVGSNAERQILQVYAYGPEPTELVLEINKTGDKCVVYTSLLVEEKGPRYTHIRHTLVWCNSTKLYCSAPLRWMDLNLNVTNVTFPRNQCEENRYGLVTHGYDKGQGHAVNTGIHWEPCIYQRGKVPKKPLEDVAMSKIQPDGGFLVTWKRYDCKVSKAYIEHYTVRYCKDNGLCKCKQDSVYVNISRTSDSYTVDNLEAGTQVCVWVAGFSKSGLGPFNNLPLTITIRKKSDNVGLIVGCFLAGLVGLVALAFVIWRIRGTYKSYKKRTAVKLPDSQELRRFYVDALSTPENTSSCESSLLKDYNGPNDIDNTDNTSVDFKMHSSTYSQGHSMTGRDSGEQIPSYVQANCMLEGTSSVEDTADLHDSKAEKPDEAEIKTANNILKTNRNDLIRYETLCGQTITDAANDNFKSSGFGASIQTEVDTSFLNNHIHDISLNSGENRFSRGEYETQGEINSQKSDDFDFTNEIFRYDNNEDRLTTISNNNNRIETAIQNEINEEVNSKTHNGVRDEHTPVFLGEVATDPDYVVTENPGLDLRTIDTAREHESNNKTVEDEVIDHDCVLDVAELGLSLRTTDTAREHVSSNTTVDEVVNETGYVLDTENPGLSLRITVFARETDGCKNERDIDELFSEMEQVSTYIQDNVSVNASSVEDNEKDKNRNDMLHIKDIKDSDELDENYCSNINTEENVSDPNGIDTVSLNNSSRIYDHEPLELENNQDNVAQTNNMNTGESDNESRTDCSERRRNENTDAALTQKQGNEIFSSENQKSVDKIIADTDGIPKLILGNDTELVGNYYNTSSIPGLFISGTVSSDYSNVVSENASLQTGNSQDEVVQTNEMNIGGENINETDSGASSFPNATSCSSLSDHSSNDSLQTGNSQDEVLQTNEMNIGGENVNETDSGANSFLSLSDHSSNDSLQTGNSQDEVVQTDEMNIGGENVNETDSGASSFPNATSCSSLSDHSSNTENEHPTDYVVANVQDTGETFLQTSNQTHDDTHSISNNPISTRGDRKVRRLTL